MEMMRFSNMVNGLLLRSGKKMFEGFRMQK